MRYLRRPLRPRLRRYLLAEALDSARVTPAPVALVAVRAGHNALEKRQPPSDPRPRPPLRRLLDWVDRPVPNTKTMYAQ